MTIEELRKTQFKKGDKAQYHNVIAEIIEIEYTEALVGLRQGEDEIEWVRCENITYIPCVRTNCTFEVGDYVIAFDSVAWSKIGDLSGGNSKCFKKATIVKLRKSKRGEMLADIIFQNGKRSNGYFLSALANER